MLELSGTFMLLTFAVFAVYGMFAAAVRDRVVARPRVLAWLRRTFAGAFAALGAKLALASGRSLGSQRLASQHTGPGKR
jgi:threonine/homoserine/homoserine lactone efflux protein